jgi:hypothetical protein
MKKRKNEMELTGAIVKLEDNRRAITPVNAAELGVDLMARAQQKRISVKENSLVACVEDFYRQKEVLRQRNRENDARMAQIDERLEDIAAGKYSVTDDSCIIFPHLPAPHIG